MTFKGIHWTGAALTTSGVLGIIGTALGWFTKNVTVDGGSVCVANPGLVTAVTAALTVAGAIAFLVAPSVSDKTNIKAALASGEVRPS